MAEQGMAARAFNAAMTVMERVTRGDSWRNTVTNVSVNEGKNATRFTPGLADYLDDETLGRLYELDGIAARIVDSVPKHAMLHPPRFACFDAAATEAVRQWRFSPGQYEGRPVSVRVTQPVVFNLEAP